MPCVRRRVRGPARLNEPHPRLAAERMTKKPRGPSPLVAAMLTPDVWGTIMQARSAGRAPAETSRPPPRAEAARPGMPPRVPSAAFGPGKAQWRPCRPSRPRLSPWPPLPHPTPRRPSRAQLLRREAHLRDAAAALGLSVTCFKELLRGLGMGYWPVRQVRSAGATLAELRERLPACRPSRRREVER
jgi:hypothetical protein